MNIKSSWILTSRDNAEKGKEEKKDATLFKVKSLLDAVKAKCNKIEPEPFHSMKEQIIPAKKNGVGLFTNIIQKKSFKWGFNNLIRAGESSVISDFFIYGW